jgi:predicted phosphodiesterase
MKNLFKWIFLFMLFSASAQESLPYHVYLIGDAGEDAMPGNALLLLKDELIANPNSAVVFLGDNVYPSGLDQTDTNSILRLDAQLQILKEYKGNAYVIPGNHDWDAQKRRGLDRVHAQQVYVEKYLKQTAIKNRDSITFSPSAGLPGPETVLIRSGLRLIIIDTQWFLHFHRKEYVGSVKQTKEKFKKELDSMLLLSKKNNEQVLIAAHHPIYTNGNHGKRKQPFRFLVNCTPFQIFGLMGINRLYAQDISNPRYKRMRKQFLSSINKYDNIIYASGHDHNLQCFKEKGNRFIVSGSGSKKSKLMKRKRFESVFQDDKSEGFIKLEYLDGKYKSTTIYRVGEKALLLEGN